MTQLTEHFSLEEITATSVMGVDNAPPSDVLPRLAAVAQTLEKVRTLLGGLPITINSGYRCPEVNAAVGGVSDSAHLSGWAADFTCPAFGDPLSICKTVAADPAIAFDQLIEEGTWVHISVAPAMRGQVLTKMAGGGYVTGLRVTPSANQA